ncbi:hypothetical protein CRU87_06870 [Aliarcobacter trophiarum LMG 25534]|uniref:HTH cro/C1-type domain-containing protein n=1 Tax=Aliarcobacter trophiarum LMG 25534 TaxID=1032241 RepID=A0AAD0VMC4_9BACT|nr:hypothetical protein [Aliarcobacter trophiarum]AXK49054.1 hypothetical protein ATR_1195 [Aliarcobacter trophiarum LMG 25534]RXJ90944.1 hypothetical protein CRU87_06870 [Aliarcobacter trophiarum LMG 25534]
MASFVPNESNSTLNGQQKVMYAKNSSGEFNRVNYGSSAEEFATLNAVNEYKELENEALIEIKNSISSPIKYFMYKNRMDLPTLCGFVNMFGFRVKRHLKMKYFLKLDDKILEKYAKAFDITLLELKSFKND